ncbi:hypothetical protein ACJVDH_08805 [Pedobacter sp. AW1-32]|uniref:hypothetical protein n=1 Tax=Pedobacter sp. AW1-32 TaxID=3383026 RepID=UPI003FF03F51
MKIWFVFVLSILHIFSLSAQNILGSRLTAMGNNDTSVPDVWALQGNGAAITEIKQTTVSLNYLRYLFSNELSAQSFAMVIPLRNNFLGIHLQRYGFSEYNESKMGFTYAKKFNQLSFALTANYHQLTIKNYGSATAVSVDAGALYTFNNQFIIGGYIKNPFRQNYFATNLTTEILTSYTVGFSYIASDKVMLATSISNTRQQAVDSRFGLEYKIHTTLSLRCGTSLKPFKQYGGIGLNYKKIAFDFAVANDNNLGYLPQISLSYVL